MGQTASCCEAADVDEALDGLRNRAASCDVRLLASDADADVELRTDMLLLAPPSQLTAATEQTPESVAEVENVTIEVVASHGGPPKMASCCMLQ